MHAAEAVTGGHDPFDVEQADMSRWHNHYPDGHAFFCTYSVEDWSPRLDERAVAILYDECDKARRALDARILAYCIMPNHVHIVIWSESGDSARKFLHRTIAQTSRRLRPGGGFWKERPRVFPAYSRHVLDVKVAYVHANPVRHKLVASPEDWPHSSFRQLMLGETSGALSCDDWDMVPIR